MSIGLNDPNNDGKLRYPEIQQIIGGNVNNLGRLFAVSGYLSYAVIARFDFPIVDYNPDAKGYHCPCHDSTFALTGQISSPSSPSPRGLDELEVELRNDNEVWVKFQNFQAGQAKKTPA